MNQSTNPAEFQISPEDLSTYLEVSDFTDNLDRALAELRARRVRLVIVVPDKPLETVQSGQRVHIRAFINEIDPVSLAFAQIDIRAQMAIVNAKIQERLIENLKGRFWGLGPPSPSVSYCWSSPRSATGS